MGARTRSRRLFVTVSVGLEKEEETRLNDICEHYKLSHAETLRLLINEKYNEIKGGNEVK